MHPAFESKTRFGGYLLAWVPISLLLILVVSTNHVTAIEAAAVMVPMTVVFAFISMSSWYTCRQLPLRAASAAKLIANHMTAALVVSAAWTLLSRLTALSLTAFYPGLDDRFRRALPVVAGVGVLLYLLSVAMHYVILAIQSSRHAEILAGEAELRALKAQINPHFLFNSLNSISALTTIDPARAREMCISLSDFLRTTLRLGDKTSISFGEELALVKNYLDVEQVRFGSRLRLEQEVEIACEDCQIPPLLIQPLVENAIKHGVATMIDGGCIRVQGHRQGSDLIFSIENDFDPDSPSPRRNGVGLVNVRSRLQARYGDAATLQVEVDKDHYRVRMSFPCDSSER